jgi:hypothetical protein
MPTVLSNAGDSHAADIAVTFRNARRARIGVNIFILFMTMLLDHKANQYGYCHPQSDAIERALGEFSSGHNIGHTPELPTKSESGQ